MKRITAKIGLSLVLALVLFTNIKMNSDAKASDKIPSGVFIDHINVSGMTEAEALMTVQSYVDSLQEVPITLHVIEDKDVVITPAEIGIAWVNQDVVKKAAQIGKKGNLVQRYKALEDLKQQNAVFPIEFSFDEAAIEHILAERCAVYNIAAIDASLSREDGTFVIEGGQTGYQVAQADSLQTIYHYLTTEWKQKECSIDLVIEVTKPRGSADDLLNVKDVLGSFTTSYSTSSSARSANVVNGCRLMNGKTLYPGDTFSALDAITPFTEANGYYMAGSYLNGMVVDSLGGGICQVSTTLYNAVLLAELDVAERQNHSMIVTYVNKSADAAISESGNKDFKFINNTEYPIYIEGTTSSNKQITFTIYGVETRPSNRTVSYESEILSEKIPEGERIIQTTSQPMGYIDVQSAHIGYTAKLWKVVKVDGVEVSRTQVNSSSYMAAPRTATVGMSTPDPDVYNAMLGAIATGSIDEVRNLALAYKAALAQQAADAAVQNALPQDEGIPADTPVE